METTLHIYLPKTNGCKVLGYRLIPITKLRKSNLQNFDNESKSKKDKRKYHWKFNKMKYESLFPNHYSENRFQRLDAIKYFALIFEILIKL